MSTEIKPSLLLIRTFLLCSSLRLARAACNAAESFTSHLMDALLLLSSAEIILPIFEPPSALFLAALHLAALHCNASSNLSITVLLYFAIP